MFTVGLIGTGKIAGLFDRPEVTETITSHSQAIHNNPNLRLVAAVNPDRKENDSFCTLWSISNKYYDIEQFLPSTIPDIVTICSPNETHFEIASRILKNKIAPRVLFVEKPVCLAGSELETLIELKRKTKCEVIVNHTRRFDPVHQKLKKIVSSGILGKVLSGKFTYYGGFFNNGVHVLDFIVYVLGNKFTLVNKVNRDYGQTNDRCIDFNLLFDDFSISIDSFDEKYYQLFEGELRFTDARILYCNFGKDIRIEKVVTNKIGERELKPDQDNCFEGLISPLRHSYDSIVQYLNGNDKALGDAKIEDIEDVMSRLFEIREKT